jgi:hypothetical protein
VEPIGLGPLLIRSLPAEAAQVSAALLVKNNAFLLQQALLLQPFGADLALGIDTLCQGTGRSTR